MVAKRGWHSPSHRVAPPFPSAASEVVFDRFGNRYFLSKVLVSGNDAALEIPKSEIQIEMERNGQRSEQRTSPGDEG